MGERQPAVTRPETLDMLGARITVVAQMGEADGDTVLIRSSMQPGASVPLHAHEDVECFYVLDGSIEVFLDGSQPGWHGATAGVSVLIASNVRHAIRNRSNAAADVILATTARVARFFHEVGRPAEGERQSPPGSNALARVVEASKRYGYWMASPEESAAITG